MVLSVFLLIASAIVIYLSCKFFVNSIEWLGKKLNLGATATGTVLAAFGTALPESAITFMSVVFGTTPEQKEIGIGAALGGPLVLATIAYSVVGVALFLKHRKHKSKDNLVKAEHKKLSRDQATFLIIFMIKLSLGLFMFSFKPLLGSIFLLAYALYVWQEIKSGNKTQTEEDLEPLKIRRHDKNPTLFWISVQVAISLIIIASASRFFIIQIENISLSLDIAPHIVALLLSPFATELPEIMNALIWVKQGKESLALANISGSMMIQATIPSALGLFFTPWMLDKYLLVSGIMTILAILVLWQLFKNENVDSRKLPIMSMLYGFFVTYVLWHF